MSKTWYDKWVDVYLNTEDEAKGFVHWYNAELEDGNIDPDVPEDDLLNAYRETQWWMDSFLDWAFVMEADERIEEYCEENPPF